MDEQEARDITRRELRKDTLAAAAAVSGCSHTTNHDLYSIVALLSKSDPKIRLSAIESLAQIRGNSAIGYIVRSLDDVDGEVRSAACSALGKLRVHSAKGELYDCLTDNEPDVRCSAAEALHIMGDRIGLSYVKQLVLKAGDHQMRALKSLNFITGKRFRISSSGLKGATEWLKPKRNGLLGFFS